MDDEYDPLTGDPLPKSGKKPTDIAFSPGEPLKTALQARTAEEALKELQSLIPLANASIEQILRDPLKYPAQAVKAAEIIFNRTLGAVPDTMIQNNMNFNAPMTDEERKAGLEVVMRYQVKHKPE